MEKAASFTASARLHAVGVIGFAPTAFAYPRYPAGIYYANKPKAMWHMNPSIHNAAGNTPSSQH